MHTHRESERERESYEEVNERREKWKSIHITTFQVQTGAHRYYEIVISILSCSLSLSPPSLRPTRLCVLFVVVIVFFFLLWLCVVLFLPQVPVRNAKRDALFSK